MSEENISHEGVVRKKGSEGSEGSAEPASQDLIPGESATVEQLQHIRKLVRAGISEKLAREEVLGKAWVEP